MLLLLQKGIAAMCMQQLLSGEMPGNTPPLQRPMQACGGL